MAKSRLHGDVVEIKAVGLRVDLEEDAPVGSGTGDLLEIEHCAATLSEQAAGRMREDVYRGVGERLEHSSSLLTARQGERGMQGDDDEIEGPQRLVVKIQAPIGENIDLRAREEGEITQAAVQLLDLGPLPTQRVPVETMGDPEVR